MYFVFGTCKLFLLFYGEGGGCRRGYILREVALSLNLIIFISNLLTTYTAVKGLNEG